MSNFNKIQKKYTSDLLKKANVVSIGQGYKTVNGEETKEKCIVVGVTDKVSKSSLKRKDVIPQTLNGVKTDVVKTGVIKALPRKKRSTEVRAQDIDPTNKFRPAMPGISIAHYLVTAGTFSCVVKRDNQRMILSNNHVLSHCNDAQIGDAIYQPGPIDGGTSNDHIADLYDFVPIVFTSGGGGGGGNPTCPIAKGVAYFFNIFPRIFGWKHRLCAYAESDYNEVDCAIAKPLNDADIVDEINQIGVPQGIVEPALNMEVQKYGRTTKYTSNRIRQTNVTVRVAYDNKYGVFVNQLITGNMSAGGDSGSAVLNMDNKLVGLLFAGSSDITILNPMVKVFEALNLSL